MFWKMETENNFSLFHRWMISEFGNEVISASEVQSLYQLESTPPDLNVTISGVVTDSTTVPGSAIVWVFDANGIKVAEQILPNGSGSLFFLTCSKGTLYDVKLY